MEVSSKQRLGRDDWIRAAVDVLNDKGVGGVKVTTIARHLGVTSGSFYWHFSKLQDLLDAVLVYWEHEMTDNIISRARAYVGAPSERIFDLMSEVIREGAAEPDHAISVWAKSDPKVRDAFERTIRRRFEFAAWMFAEAGFSREDAKARGRLLVAYLMGESSAVLASEKDWEAIIRQQLRVLMAAAPE